MKLEEQEPNPTARRSWEESRESKPLTTKVTKTHEGKAKKIFAAEKEFDE